MTYGLSAFIYTIYNGEELEIPIKSISASQSWDDFITFLNASQGFDVFYFPQYGWYLRQGGGDRLFISAPIIKISSISESFGDVILPWLNINATQIQ